MAKKVGGIAIEVAADTKNFKKDMKEVDKTLKNTQKEGYALNEALEIDPKNIELVTKKLKNLEKQTEINEQKTKAYEKELERLKNVDIDELTKEMADITESTKKAEKEAEKLRKEYDKMSMDNSTSEELKKQQRLIKEQEALIRNNNRAFQSIEKTVTNINGDIQNVETAIISSTTQTKKLESEAEDVRKVISKWDDGVTDYIQEVNNAKKKTSGLESSSNFTDSISNGMDTATAAVNGGSEEIQASLLGLSAFIAKLPIPGARIVAGVVAAVGVLAAFGNFRDESDSMMEQVQASFSDTLLAEEELVEATREFAKLFNISIQEAMETGMYATQLFGKEIQTTDDYYKAFLTTLALGQQAMASGIGMDAVIAGYNKLTDIFMLTNEQALAMMTNLMNLTSEYGQAADDVIDSLNEFGPFLAQAGVDAQTFFDMMWKSLELGARNTDQIVNIMNEMIIKAGDAKKEYDAFVSETGSNAGFETANEWAATLEQMGIDYIEFYNLIASGQLEEATAVMLEGLSGITDAAAQKAAGGVIAGTYGEESLVAMTEGYEQYTAALTASTEALEAQGIAVTSQEQLLTDLITKTNEVIAANFNFGRSTAMLAGMSVLTREQIEQLEAAYNVLKDTTSTTTEKNDALIISLNLLYESGLVTEQQMLNVGNALYVAGLNTEGLQNFESPGIQKMGEDAAFATEELGLMISEIEGNIGVIDEFKSALAGIAENLKQIGDEAPDAAAGIAAVTSAAAEMPVEESRELFDWEIGKTSYMGGVGYTNPYITNDDNLLGMDKYNTLHDKPIQGSYDHAKGLGDVSITVNLTGSGVESYDAYKIADVVNKELGRRYNRLRR